MIPKTITLYGIPNCDTVKKARSWLTENGVDYVFHEFKKQGVPGELLPLWEKAVGWEKLLNRKGTMWRKQDAATQAAVVDAASAMALMELQASVIKRPVVDWGNGKISVGFTEAAFAARLP